MTLVKSMTIQQSEAKKVIMLIDYKSRPILFKAVEGTGKLEVNL